MEKRTEQLAVRITPETKRILDEEAKTMKWSTAQLVNEILKEWTRNGRKAKELIQ